jgi:hypothetical protein
MPEPDPLHEEIRCLAEQVANGPDVVADLGAEIAAWYRKHRQQALDLAGISVFLAGGEEIDESHPFLVDGRRQLRDRLKNLLEWARARQVGWEIALAKAPRGTTPEGDGRAATSTQSGSGRGSNSTGEGMPPCSAC